MGFAQASDPTTEPMRFNPAEYVSIVTAVSLPASRAVRLSLSSAGALAIGLKRELGLMRMEAACFIYANLQVAHSV